MPISTGLSNSPECALLPIGQDEDDDRIAVVYDFRDGPPEITIRQCGNSVQTILADGIAVAVVASAYGPRITAEDVLLVQRYRPRG